MENKLHIACNVQSLCLRNQTGIGRMMRAVLAAMNRDDSIQIHAQAFVHAEENEAALRENLPFLCESDFELCRGRASVAQFLWSLFPFTRGLYFKKADVYLSFNYMLPAGVSEPGALFLYDMVVCRYPETMDRKQKRSLQLRLKPSCRRANRILTISAFSKKEIVDCLHIDPNKVTTIPLAADERLFHTGYPTVAVDEAKQRLGVQNDYFLYLGTLEPRKNITRLLDAYALLRKRMPSAPQLVIVGGKGWQYEAIFEQATALQLQERVTFAGYIADADIPLILCGARAFVFPSIYEGFGLPLLEAMACGTPVICSNAASLPEVVGDAGILVPPEDEQAICDAMERLATEDALCDNLRRKGLARARQFSWDRSAALIIDVCREMAGG